MGNNASPKGMLVLVLRTVPLWLLLQGGTLELRKLHLSVSSIQSPSSTQTHVELPSYDN